MLTVVSSRRATNGALEPAAISAMAPPSAFGGSNSTAAPSILITTPSRLARSSASASPYSSLMRSRTLANRTADVTRVALRRCHGLIHADVAVAVSSCDHITQAAPQRNPGHVG